MLPFRKVIKGVGELFRSASKGPSRNYGRKALPVVTALKNPNKTYNEERNEIMQAKTEMRRNLREQFNTSDPDAFLEPDLNNLDGAFGDYQRDYEKLDQTMHRQKMFRKHFREFSEKEVSVLTWAEKEKIRFLHNSDPQEWKEETLAAVFPVSVEGVSKVLKSTFRARSLKEIETHDLNVADRIKRIKSGEIPMSSDLEEKMKMRDQIPMNLGAIGPNDEKLLIKSQLPKIVGEFARLVTPVKTGLSTTTSNDMLMTMPAAISSLSDPDMGDSYMLNNRNELRDLKIHPKESMTFAEFESKINQNPNKNSSPSQEIEYLQNLVKKVEVKPSSLSEVSVSEDATRAPDMEDYLNYHTIPKYKTSSRNKVDVKLENSEMYIFNQETGYQKPFGDQRSNLQETDHIHVPPELRKSGAVYRKGERYYDENGEFMYRVV